ncbi:MAG: four helix bundle protein [Bacteroidia bacterium]|jgi:four helix bundle protein
MHRFKELIVWQKSRVLVKEIYKQTSTFPETERFGITSQLRRAVVSISNNIAEGAGRLSSAEFKRFLNIAYGSSVEVENMLILCNDLKLLTDDSIHLLNQQLIEIEKMLYT